jgi:hypothetical protein
MSQKTGPRPTRRPNSTTSTSAQIEASIISLSRRCDRQCLPPAAISSALILSDEAKEGLDQLAQQVLTQKVYRIEVAGFADTTGNASYNQILSGERANAFMHYLEEHGNVAIYRIITPAGMGTSHEAVPNSTSEGRKLNRRVEVRVLVNQGEVAGAIETSSAAVPQQ